MVAEIDMNGLPLPLRRVAVFRLLNRKRLHEFESMILRLGEWIHSVGDYAREIEGVHEYGDFWSLAEEWEKDLERLEDQPRPSAKEVDEMSKDELLHTYLWRKSSVRWWGEKDDERR